MNVLKWFVTSSADPTRYSLAVKGAVGLAVAWLIQISPFICAAAIICLDPTVLQSVVQTSGTIVYDVLSLISACAFLYGIARKVYVGRFSAYQTAQ